MAQQIAKQPKTSIIAHAPVPLRDRLVTVARLTNSSMSKVVIDALTAHFDRLGVVS